VVVQALVAQQIQPILRLTAAAGPWSWARTRYDLVDGVIDELTTSFPMSSVVNRRNLGTLWRTADKGCDEEADHSLTFTFDEDETTPPLKLALSTYKEGGVGAQVWDAAIATTLFLQSALATELMPTLPPHPRVLELGAGIGLPSFALARGASVSQVTITDGRHALVDLGYQNSRAAHAVFTAAALPFAPVRVAALEWGGERSGTAQPPRALIGYDLVLGSDVCYDEASVPSLAAMIVTLRAPVTIVVGPSTRPSMKLLVRELEGLGLSVDTHRLTLVRREAIKASEPLPAEADDGAMVQSGGVHLVLIIRNGRA